VMLSLEDEMSLKRMAHDRGDYCSWVPTVARRSQTQFRLGSLMWCNADLSVLSLPGARACNRSLIDSAGLEISQALDVEAATSANK